MGGLTEFGSRSEDLPIGQVLSYIFTEGADGTK